jgi:hypothetical protein
MSFCAGQVVAEGRGSNPRIHNLREAIVEVPTVLSCA